MPTNPRHHRLWMVIVVITGVITGVIAAMLLIAGTAHATTNPQWDYTIGAYGAETYSGISRIPNASYTDTSRVIDKVHPKCDGVNNVSLWTSFSQKLFSAKLRTDWCWTGGEGRQGRITDVNPSKDCDIFGLALEVGYTQTECDFNSHWEHWNGSDHGEWVGKVQGTYVQRICAPVIGCATSPFTRHPYAKTILFSQGSYFKVKE